MGLSGLQGSNFLVRDGESLNLAKEPCCVVYGKIWIPGGLTCPDLVLTLSCKEGNEVRLVTEGGWRVSEAPPTSAERSLCPGNRVHSWAEGVRRTLMSSPEDMEAARWPEVSGTGVGCPHQPLLSLITARNCVTLSSGLGFSKHVPDHWNAFLVQVVVRSVAE